MMSYRKIFWGALLVILGIVLILKNLGVIVFTWYSVWHLWPVILILWGLSLLPVRDLYKVIASIAVLLIGLVLFFQADRTEKFDFNWDSDWQDEENISGIDKQNLSLPYDSALRTALLQFDAAAGKFTLSDTCSDLIKLEKRGVIGNYGMEIENTADSATISIEMHSEGNVHSKRGNTVDLMLNTRPYWNFDLNVGAAEVILDLSQYKVSSLDIDGGACSVELKLGSMQSVTHMDIETGASSITLKIPKDAGCEVNTNTFLSNNELEGFSKTEKNTQQTENFKTAAQKIYIEMNAAVSSLKIERY